jgi:hypothetical protein
MEISDFKFQISKLVGAAVWVLADGAGVFEHGDEALGEIVEAFFEAGGLAIEVGFDFESKGFVFFVGVGFELLDFLFGFGHAPVEVGVALSEGFVGGFGSRAFDVFGEFEGLVDDHEDKGEAGKPGADLHWWGDGQVFGCHVVVGISDLKFDV